MTSGPRPDPVLGFYGPDSQMWRINREAVLLAAGPAALLLQVAHPLVAEGVHQHSAFETDPPRRLRNTLRTTLALVFGDGAQAERAVRRLNGVHAEVRGVVQDAEARAATGVDAYRALDPELLLWVQATLIHTSVESYERWVGPISPAERERFWAEARSVGVRLGIPLAVSPVDWTAFEAYWARMLAPDGPIRITPTARRLGHIIAGSPLPFVPSPLLGPLMSPAIALLPERIRAEYGLAWGPARAAVARTLDTALRLWVRLLPRSWRSMPQARSADGRVRQWEDGTGGLRTSPPPSR
ncbi:MAG: oxygenase MpaB family protein [Candidatus Limnocylindrales bacterium]